MTRENIESYYCSLAIIKSLYEKGIINDKDFQIAEKHLAKKYCIKNSSIYRSNRLINNRFRGIYIMQKKEVQNARENDNQNKCITTIRKET